MRQKSRAVEEINDSDGKRRERVRVSERESGRARESKKTREQERDGKRENESQREREREELGRERQCAAIPLADVMFTTRRTE